jgi:hypothetical protein
MRQAELKDMFQKAIKSPCTSTVIIHPDPSSHKPSASSAMETPENTEEGPYVTEPATEGEIQVVSPQISCTAQVYKQ